PARRDEVDEAGHVLPDENAELAVPRERELTLAACDGIDYDASGLVGRPHQRRRPLVFPLLAEHSVIVDARDLALDEARIDGGTADAGAVKLHRQHLPDRTHGVLRRV